LSPAHRRKLVISTEADRHLFFYLRSCEGVGLRSGESLFVLFSSRLDTRLSTRQLDILISHLLEEIHAYAILIFTARGAGENHDVI
jgi:hypothetical protein